MICRCCCRLWRHPASTSLHATTSMCDRRKFCHFQMQSMQSSHRQSQSHHTMHSLGAHHRYITGYRVEYRTTTCGQQVVVLWSIPASWQVSVLVEHISAMQSCELRPIGSCATHKKSCRLCRAGYIQQEASCMTLAADSATKVLLCTASRSLRFRGSGHRAASSGSSAARPSDTTWVWKSLADASPRMKLPDCCLKWLKSSGLTRCRTLSVTACSLRMTSAHILHGRPAVCLMC